MSRCEGCPVAGPECAGLTRPALCGLARTGAPEWVRHVRGLTEAQARPPGPATPPPARGRVPFEARTVKAMNACEARYKEECGCRYPYRCAAAYGATVRYEDCRRCLRSRGMPPEEGSEADPAGHGTDRPSRGGAGRLTDEARPGSAVGPRQADAPR